MPDSLGSQLGEKGWQAGAVIPHDCVPVLLPHMARYGQEAPTFEPHDWLVVISQTCDVVQHDLEKEPLVEILHCRPVEELRPDFQGRKSTRRLDFRANIETHANVCLTAHATADRYVVPRDLLLKLSPDESRRLSEKAVINLQEWYALRYSRPAWPDAFVDRINATKNVRKKLSTALKQLPTDDVEVRVAIKQYDQELAKGQSYNIALYFVVDRDQWNGSEEIRAATYKAHSEFVAALGACEGITVDKYMKEILGNIKQQTLLLLLSMVMFVMLFVPLAGAEVYKCKSADGKTSFSDQPCATGQKSAVIKPQTVGVGATSSSKADYKSRPEYPECLRLRNKLQDYFWNSQITTPPKNGDKLTIGHIMGGKTVLAEIRKDLARYEEICGVFDKESAREEEKKQELAENFENERSIEESKRLIAIYECAAKRRVLDERRPKFASLSADEKRLFTLIEAEVARDCK